MSAALRPEYVRWRDSPRGLAGIARVLADRGEIGRAEVEDLYRAIGELLGVGGRGGERVRPRVVRCSGARARSCVTCLTTFGHGPYLERKVGKRWVRVEETDEQREARRSRHLLVWMERNQELARALLDAPSGAKSGEGFLEGEDAVKAEAEILKHLVS